MWVQRCAGLDCEAVQYAVAGGESCSVSCRWSRLGVATPLRSSLLGTPAHRATFRCSVCRACLQVPDKYLVVEAMDAVQTHFVFMCEWLAVAAAPQLSRC